jgi:hypothetical protein
MGLISSSSISRSHNFGVMVFLPMNHWPIEEPCSNAIDVSTEQETEEMPKPVHEAELEHE